MVMEMMDVGRQHASTAFSSMAKVLVKAAGPPTHTNRFFFDKISQHFPTQPDRGGSIQLVNPLERISHISQSLLQKALALSQDESVRNSKTSGLLLASTSTSALATLPSATLKSSAFPLPTETGSQEQQGNATMFSAVFKWSFDSTWLNSNLNPVNRQEEMVFLCGSQHQEFVWQWQDC